MIINDQDPRQCVATTRDHSRPLRRRHSFPNGEEFQPGAGMVLVWRQYDEDRWALFHPEKSRDVQRGAGCVPRCTKPSVVQSDSN